MTPISKKLLFIAGVSIAANIYFVFNRQVSLKPTLFQLPLVRSQVPISKSLEGFLAELWTKPYVELVEMVSDPSHALCGFSRGELALAVLKARDDVDCTCQTASYTLFDSSFKRKSIDVPFSLSASDLRTLRSALEQSKTPFGLQGIFVKLAEDPENQDLKMAFMRSDEWLGLKKVFSDLSEEDALALCRDLRWDQFSAAIDEISHGKEITPQVTLTEWMRGGSKKAAFILASQHKDYVCIELPDSDVMQLLRLLPLDDDTTSLLVVSLLKTPRKPEIWNGCRGVLAQRFQDSSLLQLSRDEILQKLKGVHGVPKAIPKVQIPKTDSKIVPKVNAKKAPVKVSTVSPLSTYVVKKGDTMATIAAQLKMSLLELKKLNPHLLSSPRLAPGTVVKVRPQSQGRPMTTDRSVQSSSAQAKGQEKTVSSKKPQARSSSS